MATVFDIFKETEYGFVELNRGTVFGNKVFELNGEPIKPTTHMGVFKLRRGFARTGNNMEYGDTMIPILHAHPEDYLSKESYEAIIGNGVVIDGLEYEIIDVSEGKNFDNGKIEHLTFTLKEVNYAS